MDERIEQRFKIHKILESFIARAIIYYFFLVDQLDPPIHNQELKKWMKESNNVLKFIRYWKVLLHVQLFSIFFLVIKPSNPLWILKCCSIPSSISSILDYCRLRGERFSCYCPEMMTSWDDACQTIRQRMCGIGRI
jgi:hypothetical protein